MSDITKYRFQKANKDAEIRRIQQEAEDNFATHSAVSGKMDIVPKFTIAQPKLVDMADGQKIYYDDGTDKWRYERISGKLYKMQLTLVS